MSRGIGNLLKITGKFMKDNGPVIAATVSGVCWLGAVVTAVMDAPKAHEAIKAKKEKDPEAGKAELAVVGGKHLVKTIVLAGIGTGTLVLSVKLSESIIVGLGATVAALSKERNAVLDAAEEVVGKENVDKLRGAIVEKEMALDDETRPIDELTNDLTDEDDEIGYRAVRPIKFNLVGGKNYMSYDRVEECFDALVDMLAQDGVITQADIVTELGFGGTLMDNVLGYRINKTGNDSFDIELAKTELRHSMKPIELKGKTLGWYLAMHKRPIDVSTSYSTY